jgi:hypothetical protein
LLAGSRLAKMQERTFQNSPVRIVGAPAQRRTRRPARYAVAFVIARELDETRIMTLLGRLRAIIEELPETSEKLSHGSPTWWGGKKTFATFHEGSYDEGRPAVWIKAGDGVQKALVDADPDRFYRPKYLGPSGWVGMRLDAATDWDEVRELLVKGYRLVAPRRALRQLDGD